MAKDRMTRLHARGVAAFRMIEQIESRDTNRLACRRSAAARPKKKVPFVGAKCIYLYKVSEMPNEPKTLSSQDGKVNAP